MTEEEKRQKKNEWNRQYRQRNKEKINRKDRERYRKNRDKRLKTDKIYREKNKKSINEKIKKWSKQPAKYDTYYPQLEIYHECRRDEHSPELIQVRCKYCDKWFNPTNTQVKNRIHAINGIYTDGRTHGEQNFYCSDACKESCPAYKKQIHLKKPEPASSNETSALVRKMVLRRDNWTCQRCGKSKEEFPELKLHCHHINPKIKDPMEANDVENCITFCQECHIWVHQNIPHCSFAELSKCLSKK